MSKFERGDIVEYVGGYEGRHEPHSFLGSLGIVTSQDAYVRVDWISLADVKYAQRIHGVNAENLIKLGHVSCQSH